MTSKRDSSSEIYPRIKPTLDKVAVRALRAWLKSVDLSSSAYTRQTITELVAKEIASGRLAEAALENALIGFEEASEMRVYLFRLEGLPSKPAKKWLPDRLLAAKFAVTNRRSFAGNKTSPMSPVYAELVGELLRVKWAEQQQSVKLDEETTDVVKETHEKRIVLIADLAAKTAELRLNPPENRHSYRDAGNRLSPEAYYNAYISAVRKLLNCDLLSLDLRPVVRKLVDEDPRVVRIHIDNHTNQGNVKFKTTSSKVDVRDDPDWLLGYKTFGITWAWDAQSFYWMPKPSSGFLKRELFTQISAEEGFIKVNADCSDEELNYVVSQLRAR
jgi:hypothetical protein